LPSEHVLVASSLDSAGINIGTALIEEFGFEKSDNEKFEGRQIYKLGKHRLVFSNQKITEIQGLDTYFPDCSSYIFLSRHKSESGKQSLTAHFTGNFSEETELGGSPRQLSYYWPSLLARYMRLLFDIREEVSSHEITLEATHHGPTSLKKPVLFIEIGSSERDWTNKKLGSAVAGCVFELIQSETIANRKKVAIAFGGTHYPDKLTHMLTEGDEFSIGAIASKYALPFVDKDIFDQMLRKSVEKPGFALIDWKSLSRYKERIVALTSAYGLEVVRI
jgi:D-aminoacyl-tRNA deacylase